MAVQVLLYLFLVHLLLTQAAEVQVNAVVELRVQVAQAVVALVPQTQ
jgi:hypothetical protein